MNLEKILVGDDQIDFARKNFPAIPGSEIEFVSTPEELVKRAQTGAYSIIVTDLNYTAQGEEGFKVLEQLSGIPARKILWTGNAYDSGIKDKGIALGAEVLDKDEIGSLVGQVVNKAPLKEGGRILVYARQGPVKRAISQVVDTLCIDATVSSKLSDELKTGEYGLVIDTSTIDTGKLSGAVAHDMKYIQLTAVPKVVPLLDLKTATTDLMRIVSNYKG